MTHIPVKLFVGVPLEEIRGSVVRFVALFFLLLPPTFIVNLQLLGHCGQRLQL